MLLLGVSRTVVICTFVSDELIASFLGSSAFAFDAYCKKKNVNVVYSIVVKYLSSR